MKELATWLNFLYINWKPEFPWFLFTDQKGSQNFFQGSSTKNSVQIDGLCSLGGSIDIGTRGHWGHVPPQDFAINKEVPFLFLESAPFLLRRRCPQSAVPLQV